jgi:hypothetical protein
MSPKTPHIVVARILDPVFRAKLFRPRAALLLQAYSSVLSPNAVRESPVFRMRS